MERKIGQGEGGTDATLCTLLGINPLKYLLISQNGLRRETEAWLCHIYFCP